MPYRIAFCLILLGLGYFPPAAMGHDPARGVALLRARQARKAQQHVGPFCKLTVRLVDAASQKPIPGVVRISRQDTGARLALRELILREQDWHTILSETTLKLPQASVRIEALQGIETELAATSMDLKGKKTAELELPIKRFTNFRKRGWRNGNTHLHLMKRTFAEADRYLREVPLSDDLELVFLSHLRRIPDEQTYISNLMVENSLPGGDLARLSQSGVLFRPGEEHRHNFGRGGEGFGHVMLLDIAKLIRPVSIGPGIMRKGHDAQPLQTGIRQAKRDGATIIWCHNQFGYEDIPNWMSGDLDAQNIFDGGNRGSYEESYYRYLNIGLRTPFSTGTDWFIDDFSRVYVPMRQKMDSQVWLEQLRAGRSFISNGPLLEFSVNGRPLGTTLKLDSEQTVTLRGSAVSRADFARMEFVHNGKVIASAKSKPAGGHFSSEHELKVQVKGPGWFALRTPLTERKNTFGNQLYSHTSPVYVQFQNKRIFEKSVAEDLLAEMQKDLMNVRRQATFANDQQSKSVNDVYRKGIEILKRRIANGQ